MSLNYGLTGVMARCTGLKRDLRFDRMETYANYYHLNFRGYIGQKGDSFDRYLIRMNEMTESLNIVNQVVYKLTKKKSIRKKTITNLASHKLLQYISPDDFNKKKKKNSYNNMEQLIKHFKY
jgi:NADH:ubiquinone oxidoreductase subunit D